MSDGFWLVCDGPEGCGKSTQIKLLAEYLSSNGYDVVVTREPGGCPIGTKIRAILLDSANKEISPLAELLLYAADRAQNVDEVIKPALASRQIVLCDRHKDSTVAYQGCGRGLDRSIINELNHLASPEYPDLTLIFDLPVEQGLARSFKRHAGSTAETRFEEEKLDFHQRVRQFFLTLAKSNHRYRVIDASRSIGEVFEDVKEIVGTILALR